MHLPAKPATRALGRALRAEPAGSRRGGRRGRQGQEHGAHARRAGGGRAASRGAAAAAPSEAGAEPRGCVVRRAQGFDSARRALAGARRRRLARARAQVGRCRRVVGVGASDVLRRRRPQEGGLVDVLVDPVPARASLAGPCPRAAVLCCTRRWPARRAARGRDGLAAASAARQVEGQRQRRRGACGARVLVGPPLQPRGARAPVAPRRVASCRESPCWHGPVTHAARHDP